MNNQRLFKMTVFFVVLVLVMASLTSCFSKKPVDNQQDVLIVDTAETITVGDSYEKVVVKSTGAILENGKVDEIIIEATVADGEVTLNNIQGTLLTIQGGGTSSIYVIGSSSFDVVRIKREDGAVRVVAEDGSVLKVVEIEDGSQDVILSGNIGDVMINAAGINVVAESKSKVGKVTINGKDSTFTILEDAFVDCIDVDNKAHNTKLIVDGTVDEVTNHSDATKIKVKGNVKKISTFKKSSIEVAGLVQEVIIMDGAEGSELIIAKDGVVEIVRAKAPVLISGDGSLEQLITKDKELVSGNLVPNKSKVQEDPLIDQEEVITKPETPSTPRPTPPILPKPEEPSKPVVRQYVVSFLDHDGKLIEKVTVEEGKEAKAPKEPSRLGYTFDGWDRDFKKVTEDLQIVAKYKINLYVVTFVDYDSSELDKQIVEYGSNAKEPTEPTRDGYIFIGWNKEFNNVVSDLEVKAQYEKNIKVSAINVTGQGGVTTITTDGGQLEMLATVLPANASNQSVIWSVDNTNVATINSSGLLIAVSNGTVTVTAKSKDGSNVEGTATITISNQVVVDKSNLITAVNDAILLNKFVEVSADGTDVAMCQYWVTSTVKNAYEKAITDAQVVANKVNASQAEVKQAEEDLDTALNVFYESLRLGTKEVAISKITEITITGVNPPHHGAKVSFDYTIPSDANYIKIDSGEWYDDSELMKDTDTFLSEKVYKFVVTLAVQPCYDFDFQNLSATINGENTNEIKKVNEDGFIVITHEFTATGPKIYYLNFYSDDNSNTPYHHTYGAENETISLPEPPVREGYTFDGWYTEKNGAGIEFTASTIVTAEFYTLYAKWTLITYTVSFDSDGGSPVESITGVKPNTTVTLPTPPTKSGFDFGGWYTGKDGAGTEFTASTPVTGDITVYAKWNEENIPVTSISVTGEGGTTAITEDGGTLQMKATVLPATASNKAVSWSVDSTIATINSGSGLLKAVANGKVIVTATAMDGSGITGTAEIEISGQPTRTLTIEVEGQGSVSPAIGDSQHDRGSIVEIEAIPAAGWYFEKWEGDVKESHKANTTIRMSKDKTIKAVFKEGGNTADFAGGSGTKDNPYKVSNAHHLHNVRKYLDAHFIQTADIDLSNYQDNQGWEPIGSYPNSSFKGSYNGQDKKIEKMKIDRAKENHVGLFGYNTGIISNVKLSDFNIKGNDNVGGLVGFNGGKGEISFSSATGQVTGEDISIGGLVGSNYGKVSNSFGNVEVKGGRNVGGLAGSNYGEITKSSATGQVTGTNVHVGGLVGRNGSTQYKESKISFSYATGDVIGENTYVGGLVGLNDSEINQSYATGQTSGTFYVGGFVGLNHSEINQSYATGQVTGEGDNLGGLVGSNSGQISKSYWDKVTTLQDKSAGSDNSFGKTTEEMQTKETYIEWDFNSTWIINTNTYPHLRWQVEYP